jgi:hypothetical protein
VLFGVLDRKDRFINKRYGLLFDKVGREAVELVGKSGVFL